MTRGKNTKGDIRLTVAKNAKLAREYAGLSQRDMVKKTGIGQAYLSQVEDGRWNIGVDNVAKIARATGFQPHDLLNPDFEPASFAKAKPVSRRASKKEVPAQASKRQHQLRITSPT